MKYTCFGKLVSVYNGRRTVKNRSREWRDWQGAKQAMVRPSLNIGNWKRKEKKENSD